MSGAEQAGSLIADIVGGGNTARRRAAASCRRQPRTSAAPFAPPALDKAWQDSGAREAACVLHVTAPSVVEERRKLGGASIYYKLTGARKGRPAPRIGNSRAGQQRWRQHQFPRGPRARPHGRATHGPSPPPCTDVPPVTRSLEQPKLPLPEAAGPTVLRPLTRRRLAVPYGLN